MTTAAVAGAHPQAVYHAPPQGYPATPHEQGLIYSADNIIRSLEMLAQAQAAGIPTASRDGCHPVIAGWAEWFSLLAASHANAMVHPMESDRRTKVGTIIKHHHEQLLERAYVAAVRLQAPAELRPHIHTVELPDELREQISQAAERHADASVKAMITAARAATGAGAQAVGPQAAEQEMQHVYTATSAMITSVTRTATEDMRANRVTLPPPPPPAVQLNRGEQALLAVLTGRMTVRQAANYYRLPERGLGRQVQAAGAHMLAARERGLRVNNEEFRIMTMMLAGDRTRTDTDIAVQLAGEHLARIRPQDITMEVRQIVLQRAHNMVACMRAVVNQQAVLVRTALERRFLLQQQFNAARKDMASPRVLNAVRAVLFDGVPVQQAANQRDLACVARITGRILFDALNDRPYLQQPGDRLIAPRVETTTESAPPSQPTPPDPPAHDPWVPPGYQQPAAGTGRGQAQVPVPGHPPGGTQTPPGGWSPPTASGPRPPQVPPGPPGQPGGGPQATASSPWARPAPTGARPPQGPPVQPPGQPAVDPRARTQGWGRAGTGQPQAGPQTPPNAWAPPTATGTGRGQAQVPMPGYPPGGTQTPPGGWSPPTASGPRPPQGPPVQPPGQPAVDPRARTQGWGQGTGVQGGPPQYGPPATGPHAVPPHARPPYAGPPYGGPPQGGALPPSAYVYSPPVQPQATGWRAVWNKFFG